MVVYLIFNEGYTATSGVEWMRAALSEEALRLRRMLRQLLTALEQAQRLGGGAKSYALQAALPHVRCAPAPPKRQTSAQLRHSLQRLIVSELAEKQWNGKQNWRISDAFRSEFQIRVSVNGLAKYGNLLATPAQSGFAVQERSDIRVCI
jgi:hypothetical protein